MENLSWLKIPFGRRDFFFLSFGERGVEFTFKRVSRDTGP